MHSSRAGLAVVVGLVAASSWAEASSGSRSVLLINPGDLINGAVTVEYERALSPRFGLELGVSVTMFRGVFAPPTEASVLAFGPEIGLRLHVIRDAPGGLWFGPALTAVYVAQRSGGQVTRAFGYGVSAALGYNFILLQHLVIQLGLGGGFADYGDGIVWSPHFRVGLGAAF